jgi:hypothetical protein
MAGEKYFAALALTSTLGELQDSLNRELVHSNMENLDSASDADDPEYPTAQKG